MHSAFSRFSTADHCRHLELEKEAWELGDFRDIFFTPVLVYGKIMASLCARDGAIGGGADFFRTHPEPGSWFGNRPGQRSPAFLRCG